MRKRDVGAADNDLSFFFFSFFLLSFGEQVGDPVLSRFDEAQKRPVAEDAFRKVIRTNRSRNMQFLNQKKSE
jgi:hypothetical protein